MSQKTQEKRHICAKNPLFLTVLAYIHCCPGFQDPVLSSSTHHWGLAAIVKKRNCLIRDEAGVANFSGTT